jgi:hypothetical protein
VPCAVRTFLTGVGVSLHIAGAVATAAATR